MAGSTGVAESDLGAGGHPGERSRPALAATATCAAVTAPRTAALPKRAVIAVRAASTAARTSPHTESDALGTVTSTPAVTATVRNQLRTASARAAAARNQPRTVDPGMPNRCAIGRCPLPRAFATNAVQINSARYALRSNNVTGSSTCVTAHPRQRARRGRTGVTTPTTGRDRAKPHPANTPSEHDGQDISPLDSRDSTRTGSTSTVTISAFRTTHGAPVSSAKNSAGAPCTHQFLVTLTVQTTKINPTLTPPPRSATSLTNTYPLLGTPSDAQHTSPAASWPRVKGRGP